MTKEDTGQLQRGGAASARCGMMCFECLQRQILTNCSAELVFRYGVSNSALPFGSAAVVEVSLNKGPEEPTSAGVAAQFLLVQLPNQDSLFLSSSPGDDLSDARRSLVKNDVHTGEISTVNTGGTYDFSTLSCSPTQPFDCQGAFMHHGCITKLIDSLSPACHVGIGSYTVLEKLLSKSLCGFSEEDVMSSLHLFVEGKAPGIYSVDFFKSIGLPSFVEKDVPHSVRHPNVAPIASVLQTIDYVYLIQTKAPYTLENILHYSPNTLKSDWQTRFLIYQILSALNYIHSLGYAHGNICPSSIMLTDGNWSWLSLCDGQLDILHAGEDPVPHKNECCNKEKCPCQSIYADLRLSSFLDWESNFRQWWVGELSNYEYLLILNKIAGRRWGDHTFHTVMPWVIDFSVKPDENSDAGWRDLEKSKWRLAKGDEQLDFTYSTSEVPHHISDECLSELAVCSYKARRLPLSILRSAVRSVYEPNEYPSSMQRLYQWTPDECIPEFYTDPRIFSSLHPGMSDLSVPSWAQSPEEFISLHRAALESNHVSQQIHNWIDITFGYKLSGEASILAKNVMLSTSDPTVPKSTGRRQLFTRPHPVRQCPPPSSGSFLKGGQTNRGVSQNIGHHNINCSGNLDAIKSLESDCVPSETSYLQELEEAVSFCEEARHLCPVYCFRNAMKQYVAVNAPTDEGSEAGALRDDGCENNHVVLSESSDVDLACLLESFEVDDDGSMGFQELLHWRSQPSASEIFSEHVAGDIFSVGCVLAELYLKRPLFDSVSLKAYLEDNVLPCQLSKLPPHVGMLVESCILKDWKRRPPAKSLLESQYFPPTVKAVHHFVSPLQVLSKAAVRLQYAARLAREGALRKMGPFAAEMCAPYCLGLITTSLSDVETESALGLLKEFVKCLKFHSVRSFIFPTIQKVLQAADYSHLKFSLLQDSFVREVWKYLGKHVYLEKMHPLIISNLCNNDKISSSAASVLLIGSSEELGLPVTIHQTIFPLMHYFGRGLSADGIDTLVRIGGLLGVTFVSRHLFPLLRTIALSCIDASHGNKPEPVQSWNSLALIDCFAALHGLVKLLPKDVILKEVILDKVCLHSKALLQTHLDLSVIQVVATTLVTVCHRIGGEFTALHVLPQLKELFEELAFSQEGSASHSSGKNLKPHISKIEKEVHLNSRLDLVLLLYPSFASLVGIEKLRQSCTTWFLLEQFLEKFHNWKVELVGETSRSDGIESSSIQRVIFSSVSSLDYNPAKLLLNGVGWSIPQSQGTKGMKSSIYSKQLDDQQSMIHKDMVNHNHVLCDPWFWLPSAAFSWDVTDTFGRVGGFKDEVPWKVRATVLCSARAHPGSLQSLAVCHDECTVFTGGVGPGFKGIIQKWELPRMNCVSGYYGHDEVVNDICILSVSGKMASCDGTIHIWSSLSGKLISSFAESSSFPSPVSKVNSDPTHMLTSSSSSGIYSNALNGNMYTCMHHLDYDDKIVAGTGSGSIRFIDIAQERKLHLWKSDAVDNSLSSVVSAICSCGSDKLQAGKTAISPHWLVAGLSSGHCRLLDARSGEIVALWRAHDGYITKLAAPEEHMIVSSSLDKTLRIWDLRRSLSSQSTIFTGHTDGISSFAIWGHDIISISRNKIGLSSLSRAAFDGAQQQHILPRKLFSAERGTRNLSVLSAISILPFSRLFIVGTEDGHLKVCC